MHLDRKSCSTIIADKLWLIRCLILSITGLKAMCYLGVSSQAVFLAVGGSVGSTMRSWTLACATTWSSLQRSHLPELMGVMYAIGPLAQIWK
jgi:hypothetical protein